MRTADLLPIPNFGAPRQQAPQAAAASVSSPGRAAAVTNPAPEVMALTAPGMARDLGFQAKASVGNGSTVPDNDLKRPANRVSGEASRRVAARSATATSERMDVTAGRDRQPIPIPEPAKSVDPDQSVAGGVLIPSMAAKQLGELEAGEATMASARAASSPALRAPADPDAVEGGCGHAPALSTAARAFGPGDVLARFETDLASIVADINAHERFMRGLPAFIAAPSAAYLTAISHNP